MLLLRLIIPALCLWATTVAQEEVSLGSLSNLAGHDISGEVVILSDRVLEIRGFTYDGTAPAVFFWADTNSRASAGGYPLLDAAPTNGCGLQPIQGADGSADYRVEFPEGTSIADIAGGSISIWCEAFTANFGQVTVPVSSLETPLPEGPALTCSTGGGGDNTVPEIARTPQGYNCEPLNDEFQVRWKVSDDATSIDYELVSTTIIENDYMAFGSSGSSTETLMTPGGDPVVCDTFQGEFRAIDFDLNDRSQCSGSFGACPDSVTGSNNDVTNVSGDEDFDLGVTLVRYTKPLAGSDATDKTVSVEAGVRTFVIWALGPVSPNTGFPQFHSVIPRQDVSIEFGREVVDNCEPLVQGEAAVVPPPPEPFFVPILQGEQTIVAQIGPSGGDRGYSGITGRTSWGIAWYMNDLLIPVIEMRRGTTYTFKVSGGDNPNSNSQFHPFYLTTGETGGYAQLSPEDRAKETVLAGINITEVDSNGDVLDFTNTASAPICQYKTTDGSDGALEEGEFQGYFDSLDTSCQEDSAIIDAAAVFEFTPDDDTPDEIYYHCVTHRNLGWKIVVLNEDDAPLTPMPVVAPTPAPVQSPTLQETSITSGVAGFGSSLLTAGACILFLVSSIQF